MTTITVEKLIKTLQDLNRPKAVVLVSSDPEGNFFWSMDHVYEEQGLKFKDSDCGVELFSEESIEDGELTKAEYKKLKDCIVLFP